MNDMTATHVERRIMDAVQGTPAIRALSSGETPSQGEVVAALTDVIRAVAAEIAAAAAS